MKFYNVKDDYIQFLRGYDSKVAANLILKKDSELTTFDRNVKSRCCNLALLESVYGQYTK